ncbi:hypothetical protein GS399_18035 [Pedobacter sp. HMF7647]|uniref:DUF4878 domain-containing protein n=1 Tax=Hufsiella arboris TaxID=2695275 RepID=A0A7K1YE41_9SPHI|nr:nuclear transport factor 2 family protein [Hufsiella arboris]MXV52877.1 hypothetical protein [Hufsiella arboris]
MKTLKFTFVAIALAACSFVVKADEKTKSAEKLTMRYAANTYVNAFAHGQIKDLADVIDDDAKFTISQGKKVVTHDKSEIVSALKNIQGVEQNCDLKTSMIESLPDQVIVKVTMKYTDFERIDYVTMSQTDKGWKITNVSSAFQ